MSYQYDIEEQADGTGYVLAPDAGWRERFTPVAPVQLTRAWSPLPRARHQRPGDRLPPMAKNRFRRRMIYRPQPLYAAQVMDTVHQRAR